MSWQSLAAVLAADESGVGELLSSRPTLPEWSTYAAVAFGGLAGAAFAARRGFDLVGVLGLAIAQGMGGLLLESILLQTGTPEVLVDGRYLGLVTLAAVLGFFFAGFIARAVQSAILLDALSLGLLCAVGTNAALRAQLDLVPAVFIGVVTAVGGIILRDVLAGRPPEVLRPGILIAAAALIGAILFVVLVEVGATRAFAQIATIVVVTAIRFLSVQLGWSTSEAHDLSDRVGRLLPHGDERLDVLDGEPTGPIDRSDR